MTAPKLSGTPARKLVRLPDLGDERIPGWKFTRHAVAWTLGIFAALAVTAFVGASLVTMRVTVSANGVLEPAAIYPVRPAETGILTAILVRTGDTVVAGQIVARLDSTAASASISEIQSQIRKLRIDRDRSVRATPIDAERLQAAVTSAEIRVFRARTLLRQRMADFLLAGDPDSVANSREQRVHVGLDAPSADLLAAKSDLEAARAQLAVTGLAEFDIATNESELRRLEETLVVSRSRFARHVVRSPASGVVLTEQLELLPGGAVLAGQPLLEIADVRRWRATLNVGERDVYRVHVGDTVDVEIPAFATMAVNRVRGRVESVGWQSLPSGSSGAESRAGGAYRILVTLDSQQLEPLFGGVLRRGYAVHGEIVTRSTRALNLIVEYFRDRARGLAR